MSSTKIFSEEKFSVRLSKIFFESTDSIIYFNKCFIFKYNY